MDQFEKKDCKVTDKVLLLEGKNDCHVVKHICLKNGIDTLESFAIFDCGGYSKVLDRLPPQISAEGMSVIGIIVDCDQPEDNPNLQSELQAITDKLHRICKDYVVPEVSPNGIIISSVGVFPKVGIWFMPNNQDVGMLENFLMELASGKNEPSLNFAQKCVDEAKEKSLTTFKETHYAKAIIHTYLAWHDEPGDTLGISIRSDNLDANAQLALSFVMWLKELFKVP